MVAITLDRIGDMNMSQMQSLCLYADMLNFMGGNDVLLPVRQMIHELFADVNCQEVIESITA